MGAVLRWVVKPPRRLWLLTAVVAVVAALVVVPFTLRSGSGMPAAAGSTGAAAASASASAVPSVAPAPVVQPSAAGPAVAAADAVAAAGRWWLGAAVLDRDTGQVVAGAHGNEPDYTASLSKLLVVIDVLEQRRAGRVVLTATDANEIRRALGPSDDSAMNYLWGKFDGLGALRRVGPLIGLTATTQTRDPEQWAEMMTSAVDVVRMWRYVLEKLPPGDRDFVLSAAAASPAPAADGFDQDFGLFDERVEATVAAAASGTAGEPAAGGVVGKQGWMCCFRNQFTLHSSGIPSPGGRYVVALLTRQPMAGGWAGAEERVSTAALALVRAFG